MSDAPMLPPQFAEWERFAPKWCVGTANGRFAARMDSTMAELQEFYDAVVPRGEEAIAYLDDFDLDELPEAETNLLWLLCSLSMLSFAVDIFKQPKVPDSGDADLPVTFEPVP